MRIHIGESDKWGGKSLHEAIVELVHREGFSGVTVLRGVGGYGSSSRYHTDKILRLSQDLPIVIEVVEETQRIEQILPKLDAMVAGGLAYHPGESQGDSLSLIPINRTSAARTTHRQAQAFGFIVGRSLPPLRMFGATSS